MTYGLAETGVPASDVLPDYASVGKAGLTNPNLDTNMLRCGCIKTGDEAPEAQAPKPKVLTSSIMNDLINVAEPKAPSPKSGPFRV